MTLADYLAPTPAQLAAAWMPYLLARCWYCQRAAPRNTLPVPLPNGHYACVRCLLNTTK